MSSRKQTTYNSPDCYKRVWNLAKPVKGKDPDKVRQDPYGNKIQYGKGDIDHIKPKSRGGSDNIRNLQLLSASVNRSKGNALVKASRHTQK
jgi:5-methylcytosine-specific restriction endonuclease McrA